MSKKILIVSSHLQTDYTRLDYLAATYKIAQDINVTQVLLNDYIRNTYETFKSHEYCFDIIVFSELIKEDLKVPFTKERFNSVTNSIKKSTTQIIYI